MSHLLTRQDLRALLLQWQAGDITHRGVFDWANERYGSRHWDSEDEIVEQVLLELYSLDMNLTTAEDVPHLLALLEVPRGQIGTAKALQREHARSVSLQARRAALAKDPLYGPHCKLSK